jgi:hypothetical protein
MTPVDTTDSYNKEAFMNKVEIPAAKNFDHIECPFCRDFAKMRDDHDYYGPSKYHPGRRVANTKYTYGVDIHYECYVDGEYRQFNTTHKTYPIRFCPCCGKKWDEPEEVSYT